MTLVEFEEHDYLDRCDDDEEYDTLMTKFYKDIEVKSTSAMLKRAGRERQPYEALIKILV